jgi:hypothetical protein
MLRSARLNYLFEATVAPDHYLALSTLTSQCQLLHRTNISPEIKSGAIMPQRPGLPPKPPGRTPPVMTDPWFRITTTNENWRGKNDPAERRRIQNRINQRAFRERQRSGEATKEYNPRGKSVTSASPDRGPVADTDAKEDEDEDDEVEGDGGKEGDQAEGEDENEDEDDDESSSEDDDDEEEEEAEESNSGSPPPNVPTHPHFTGQICRAASTPSTPSTDNPLDELAQLINRNFMQAAATNAQHLGLNLTSLRTGTPASTPRLRNVASLPPTLKPVELQHQLPHDPIIDIIPHPRLRFNIVRAIATGNLDASRFSASLRRSGAVLNVQGEARRGGLIVWSFPEQLSSWELSEAFFVNWGFLLEGCEDFVTATNVWRSRRGEQSLVLGTRVGGR